MIKYCFIDESGDLGVQSKYFIVSALVVPDISLKSLNRIIKNMRRNKFQKQLVDVVELKASDSKPDIVKYLLFRLNEISGIRIYNVIVEKNKIYSSYLMQNKHKLYNYSVGKLASIFNFSIDDELEIRIDYSKGKQFLRDDFNNYFFAKIPCTVKRIYHSNSENWDGLQVVDFIAWAVFQKMERGDSSYIDIICCVA